MRPPGEGGDGTIGSPERVQRVNWSSWLHVCMYSIYAPFFFFSLLLRAELWVLSSLDILLPSPDPLCPSAQDSTRLASPPLRIASAHATTRSRVQSTSGASNHCQTLVPMPCHGSHWPVWALTAPWKST